VGNVGVKKLKQKVHLITEEPDKKKETIIVEKEPKEDINRFK